MEWHPAADGKPIEGVCNLVTFGVVERDRPEGVSRWHLILVEMECVFVRSVERPAGLVTYIQGVDGILGEVCSETNLGDPSALQVPVAIDTHNGGVH